MLLGISRYIDPHLQCVVRIPTLGANCAPKMGHPVAEDGAPGCRRWVSDCRRWGVDCRRGRVRLPKRGCPVSGVFRQWLADLPVVAEGIDDSAYAPAVFVRDGPNQDGSGRDCPG